MLVGVGACPDTLRSTSSVCPGCGLALPRGTLPQTTYFNTSAECWSVYCEVLQAEYQDPVLFAEVHQWTVDAYAVQHAGAAHPDKSVDVHLVGVHCLIDRGMAHAVLPGLRQRLVAAVREWPRSAVPVVRGALTVLDVAMAASREQHDERVRAWAREVWRTWRAHHAAVVELASESGLAPQAR